MKCRQISELVGFFLILLTGSFLHFAYEFSGNNAVVGAFTPVNESVWEHLKLLFFPALLLTVAELIICREDRKGLLLVKAIAALSGIAAIVVSFYTYSGIIGYNFLIADLLTFVIGAAVNGALSLILPRHITRGNIIGAVIFAAMTLAFIIFTFYPPDIAIFISPV